MFTHYGLHKQYVFRVIHQLKVDATNTCFICANPTNGRHRRRCQCHRRCHQCRCHNRKMLRVVLWVFFFRRVCMYVWRRAKWKEKENAVTKTKTFFPAVINVWTSWTWSDKKETADKIHMCHRRNNFINLISCILFASHRLRLCPTHWPFHHHDDVLFLSLEK